jgi:hypothetical protein
VTQRCAIAADDRHESLAGTASRADRFILIEHFGPWPGKAVEAFGPDVRAALAGIRDAKVLLMRRPSQRERGLGERRWAITDARTQRIRWGTWDRESDLLAIAEAADTDPEGWGREPVILVCTHARHDACCGIHGKPVATALAATFDDAVWTCSHVGGHRFAGNVVLPLDGTYYGRMSPVDAVSVIGSHRHGRVAVEHLRGFSWMAPAAQVVAVEAHRRWGPAPADGITAVAVTEMSPGRWQVELSGSRPLPSLITAVVEERPADPAPLSCGADPEPTTAFVVVTLDAAE